MSGKGDLTGTEFHRSAAQPLGMASIRARAPQLARASARSPGRPAARGPGGVAKRERIVGISPGGVRPILAVVTNVTVRRMCKLPGEGCDLCLVDTHRRHLVRPLCMNPISIIAGLVALVWGVVLIRRAGLVTAALLTLLAGICCGSEFFSMGALTIDRVLLVAICAVYVVMSQLRLTEPKPISWADVWLFAFMATVILSTFTHDWRWQKNLPLSRLVFYYASPCLMYWIARQSRLSQRTLRNVYLCVGAFGLYLAVTAIFEMKEFYGLVFPRYIASREYLEFLGRGRGPLLNPSGNGILLCLGLYGLLMAWPRFGKLGRLGLMAAYLVFAAGIYATLTRCVWLGAAAGTLLVAHETFSVRLKKVAVFVSVLTVIVIVPANWDRLVAFKRDKNVSVHDMKDSARLRPLLALVAWNVFCDKPLAGVGYGQYTHYNKYYVNNSSSNAPLVKVRDYHQHNIFLSLLTETGACGMALFVTVLACWAVYAGRLWRSTEPLEIRQLGLLFLTLFAAYLSNGMFQDVTIVPMVHMTLFFFAGLTVGQYQLMRSSAMHSNRPGLAWYVLNESLTRRRVRLPAN